MPEIPDNLDRLHQHEEQIRNESVQAISEDDLLADHLRAVNDALDHVTVLLHVETKAGDSAHTIQLLGMRLFSCAASALKLSLSGYYQVAFQVLRDSLGLVNLVDLFRIDSNAVERWKAADDKTLKREFGPARVRLLLEKHPDFAGQRRDHAYATFSGYASHPSYKGFSSSSHPTTIPSVDRSWIPSCYVRFLRIWASTSPTLRSGWDCCSNQRIFVCSGRKPHTSRAYVTTTEST